VCGGINLVGRLPEEQKRSGIIGCTTGNLGQALANASRLFGVGCVLVAAAVTNPDQPSENRDILK
jgi:threonine dehydratase